MHLCAMFSISSVQTLILKQSARRRAVLVPKVPDYQFFSWLPSDAIYMPDVAFYALLPHIPRHSIVFR